MKVVATAASSKLGVKVKELGRIARPGEEFEVSPSRYKILNGGNRYRSVFAVPAPNRPKQVKEVKVEPLTDGSIVEKEEIVKEPIVEPVLEEVKPEKKKRTRKTTKKKVVEND